MDFSEKYGKDIDEAVELALTDLGLTIDEVEVTVLEQPSKGFLGIGSRLAKVRVQKKDENTVKHDKISKKSDKKEEKSERYDSNHKDEKEIEYNSEIEAIQEKEVISEKKESIDELNEVPVMEHPAGIFITSVINNMGLNLDIKCRTGQDTVHLTIEGKDSGTIIGKRGQTLDSLQYLTSLVVNKNRERESYIKVILDAENYREKREKTLEQLANRLADKVIKSKRNVRLEPMNPYERKVIHATLQSKPNIMTRSEGEEPYRRVVITYK